MGPNLLNAAQLARWFNAAHSAPPNVPSLNNNVTLLAQTFIDQGRLEGVRGDIAFVQSIIETGWFGYRGSQIPPDSNNFAGIHALRRPRRTSELQARRLRAEPLLQDRALGVRDADATAAQLRRCRRRSTSRTG